MSNKEHAAESIKAEKYTQPPKTRREPMIAAVTEEDELWFEMRLKMWPRDLRNWLRKQERLDRIEDWRAVLRNELSGVSSPQGQTSKRPRRILG